MDNTRVGQLICQLRKEKELTQQQLADLLHISNKTISKWECGDGCPDLALWPSLSSLFGVDIQKMMTGKLEVNRPDIGKMDKVSFYACPICGNILTSTGIASISCCGRKLSPLKAELYVKPNEITIEEMDIDYYIQIPHEMTKEHFISFTAYVLFDRVLITRLYPEQDAAFRIPLTLKNGILYFYCSQHGLQKVSPFIRRR